jgi:hypothetical protein
VIVEGSSFHGYTITSSTEGACLKWRLGKPD